MSLFVDQRQYYARQLRMDIIEHSVGGEMYDAISAQLRSSRGHSTRLEIQRLHALTLRNEGQYRRGLTPRAEQSPETTFGADHSCFPAGPRHLLESDVRLTRIVGSGFLFGSNFAHIPTDSRIVIREDRIGQNRERLFRRLAPGRFGSRWLVIDVWLTTKR